MYARYRTRSRFYKRPEKVLKAYNVSPNFLRRPKVKPGLLHGVYTDEKVDLRDRERLELLESIRHPKERDFYQDHTYHNQWVARDLEKHQKMQLQNSYRYFHPDHEVKKWIWYPGDVVEVIRGEGRGQRGAIIAVVKYKNELLVQNINVQDVTIPATDTRPEQIVQREHPINVSRVQHVDPSTNELCNLELVKVRNKETGELEERRISMETGVLLPIPNRDDSMDVGDPLKDTPIQDADEPTYDASKEMPLLVQRRLQAMENHFIKTLKSSYKFHEKLRQVNARDMQQFQLDVVEQAAEKIAKGIAQRLDSQSARGGAAAAVLSAASNTSLPSWWEAMVAPHVEAVEEEERLRAEEELQRANNDADTMRAENEAMMQEDELDEDEDEDDDDMENPERA